MHLLWVTIYIQRGRDVPVTRKAKYGIEEDSPPLQCF
jgi:hypothetical protein